MSDQQNTTVRSDRHLMPWVIAAKDDAPVKDCVLVATMDGSEILSISLHVVDQRPDSSSQHRNRAA